MNTYNKLKYLSLGSIEPAGFLHEQLVKNKNGLGGYLRELEPGMIRDPFIKRTYVKAWVDGNQEGWGAEISGNYYTGFIGLAYILKDEKLIKEAAEWAEAFLSKQRPDGYMGTYGEPGADIYDDYNAWGTACGMRALLNYYSATGKEYVFDAVYRCMLWFCENWAGEKKTLYAGIYITEIMIQCYIKTKDSRLLRFCEDYYDFLERKGVFFNSLGKYLSDKLPYNSHHTAGLCSQVKLPALLYMATGSEKYLKASENIISKMRKKCMQANGGAVCNTEYIGPPGAISETEYCAYTFLNASYSDMAMITGNARYCDFMEEIFYNGAQGARKKDERAIAYMSAPNQIFATDTSSPIFGDMQVYAPCYPTSCCPVNSVLILSEFMRAMAMEDIDGNLYITAYGPCRINGSRLTVEENTLYPFRNNIKLTVKNEADCRLYLKIPKWCQKYTVKKNGAVLNLEKKSSGFVCITDTWQKNDTVELLFEAKPEVIKINDGDGGKRYPLAFKYGALLFSLPIPEKWNVIEGSPMTKLPQDWHWYNVEPEFEDDAGIDSHDVLGYRKEIIRWNVAVSRNIASEDITVEECETDGYAWSAPLIKLKLKGYKAPDSFPPYLSKTMEPYGEFQPVTRELNLELVPYGCTNLRITYFPKAEL